jgi:hypothetical protein
MSIGCTTNWATEVTAAAQNRIGPYRGTITSTDIRNRRWNGEDQVIIGCDIVVNGVSQFKTDQSGGWIDDRYRNSMPRVTNGGFCDQGISASTVLTGYGIGQPHSHIYLCPRTPLNSAAAMSFTPRIHDGWRQLRWDNFPYDGFTQYMSQVLTHEFCHVIDPINIIDYGLPSYTFNGIQTLNPQQRITNAHSFSYTVVALWLRHNTMGSQGQRFGTMSRKFPRNNRPAPGPHYDQNP